MLEHYHTRSHYMARAAYAGLALAALGIALIIYWVVLDGVYMRRVIVFDGPLQTTAKIYQPGDMVRYKISFCKYRSITPQIQWTLINSYMTIFVARDAGIGELGCRKDLIAESEKIPLDAVPGKYHLNLHLKYQVNPARIVEYDLHTNDFEIVNEPLERVLGAEDYQP